MKVVTIVGARPQFIKAGVVSHVLRKLHEEILVHTGQHYDREMSDLIFIDLKIPKPNYELGIGSGLHGWQTGQMLIRCEEILLAEKPDWVLVYGDTNSTLAAALAAAKLHIPIAHVEAGLRSFNRSMPEEINRLLTDHSAQLLFCPTENAVQILAREGISDGVHFVGDVMFDAVLQHSSFAREHSTILSKLNIAPKAFVLVTIHRPYNTDKRERLREILNTLKVLELPVIFPIHPRTKKLIEEFQLDISVNVNVIPPMGYLDMLALEQAAQLILTDSGGIQKEAYFFKVPCVTLRPETEWVETVTSGWNRLAWGDVSTVLEAVHHPWPTEESSTIFGSGNASEKIVNLLQQ